MGLLKVKFMELTRIKQFFNIDIGGPEYFNDSDLYTGTGKELSKVWDDLDFYCFLNDIPHIISNPWQFKEMDGHNNKYGLLIDWYTNCPPEELSGYCYIPYPKVVRLETLRSSKYQVLEETKTVTQWINRMEVR